MKKYDKELEKYIEYQCKKHDLGVDVCGLGLYWSEMTAEERRKEERRWRKGFFDLVYLREKEEIKKNKIEVPAPPYDRVDESTWDRIRENYPETYRRAYREFARHGENRFNCACCPIKNGCLEVKKQRPGVFTNACAVCF